MPHIVDTVWFVAGSSGTADFSNGSALTGSRTMSSATSGETYSYRAEHPTDKTIWENGRGVWNGTVLARTTIVASSTGSKISFAVAPVVLLSAMEADWTALESEATVASAGTVNLGSIPDRNINITGTTTITSFGTVANVRKNLRFSGAVPITHHGTTLIVHPGGASITMVAGDTAIAQSDGSGNFRLIQVNRVSGKTVVPLVAADISDSGAVGRSVLQSATAAVALEAIGAGPFVGDMINLGASPELPALCVWPFGQNLSRTTYALLFDKRSVQFTGNVTNGQSTISTTSKDISLLGLIGKKIEGTGIPAATTITAATATTITLSVNATATNTGVALRIFSVGNGDGSTTFKVEDARGRVLAGRDNMSGTSADRLTGVSGGINGDILANEGGEQSHVQSTAEIGVHSHGMERGTDGNQTGGGTYTKGGGVDSFTANAGSSTAFNVVQPTLICNFAIFAGA